MSLLEVGALFANRFELEREAGSGGMGVVYRARDRYTGEPVALKLLHPDSRGFHEAERFMREAQLLSELRHPGIVSYVAQGQTLDGQRFLAMEWLEGEDLAQRLQRGPLPLSECTLLLERITDALSFAHQRGVIHRDLKPTNLFLPDGNVARVKILDFGIARRLLGKSHAVTRTGMIIGTPEYMAPEQARGARDISPAADVFSLGCVLYECLTGQPPFVAEHLAAVLVRILFEEPVSVDERRPGVPARLSELLHRSLQKDPAQRFADASSLRSFLADLGELPERPLARTAASPQQPARTSFAESEQGLFSVVLAAPPDHEAALAQTPQAHETLDSAERQSLLGALLALGVSAEFLASGALVVTIPQMQSAADQATIAAHAALLTKRHWPEATVALATGRGMIQGRMAMGEVVEQAARFLRRGTTPSPSVTAEPGVFVDELTARLLEGRFALRSRQPGGALLLSEEKAADASRPLLGKPTPCVGREGELGNLEIQLTACAEESEARALLFTGPPGTGKSRLRYEFLRRVAQRGEQVTVVLGRGDLMTAGAPYGILAQALRKTCGLVGGEPPEVQRRQLTARIGQFIATAAQAQVVEFVAELCAVPFPDEGSERLAAARKDPRLMHDQIRGAFVEWLRAECKQAVVLLVLDDLQWGDSLSVGLIDAALRELKSAPLCVLALGRPELHETFPKLWAGHHLSEIPLKGLGRRACERLIQQVLGKQVSVELTSRLIEQSAGNPLFLEELIRAVGEEHTGQPETVVAMLQARIGRFESGPRRIVRAASVFGQTFSRLGIAELLGMPGNDPELDRWLMALVEAELLEQHGHSQRTDNQEYAFRHALARDAAYALLRESDLKTGHRLAARYLERTGEAKPLVLAEHYRRSGEPERTVPIYVGIAEEAARMLAFPEARQHFGKAKAVLDELPDSPENQRSKVDVLLRQVQLGLLSEIPELNLDRLAQARTLLAGLTGSHAELADKRRSGWIDLLSGRIHHYQGRHGDAVGYYKRVLPLGEELGDEQLLAIPSQLIGMAISVQGHIGKSLPLLARAVALQDQLDSDYERLRTMSMYGSVLVYSGQYLKGMAQHERVLLRALESGQATSMGLSRIIFADSHRQCGDLIAWFNEAHSALVHIRSAGDLVLEFSALSHIGWAHSFLGQPLEARSLREKAKTVAQQLGGHLIFADWFSAADAEIAMRAGNLDEALVLTAQLAPVFRTKQQLFALGLIEQVWGLTLGRRDPSQSTQADEHLHAALAVMEASQQVMAAARLRLEWADLCRRRGSLDQAAALRAHAVAQLETAGCAHVTAGLESACALGWE